MNKFKNLWTSLFFLLLATIGTIQAQVTADFAADDLVVCPGVPVIFTDLSTYPAGSSPTYLWSFPSGFASSLTEANPTVYYYTPGTYSVTLTTTVAGTGSDVETKTGYITVVTPPDANFTFTIPDLCNQMVINFTNTSTTGSAPITTNLWDFDDATFSSGTNPIKTFTSENTFNVILFVTDANGCSDNVTVPVTTLAPVESAISSTGAIFSCGTALAPTISAITAEGTSPYTYSWDYGNGTNSTLPSSVVNYSDCGTYDVSYTVTDANGCSLTNTYDDYIEISCPEVDFSMSDDTVCLETTASFTNLSDPGAESYYWQFNYPTALATSTEENPVAEFVAAGMRIIRLTVTYPGGCTAYHQDTIEVVPRPTITGIVASDTTGCEIPFVTTLSPIGLTGTGPFTYLWESGGMTSTDSAATFTYNDYINYTVSLTITDANGCSVFYSFIGFIKIKKPTNAFSATPVEGCAPLKVTFTNTSSSTYVPLSYFVWNYGDGTIDTTYSLGSHNHWFMAAGTYNVTMTLYTVDGCPKTSNLYITVGNEVAYFEIINDDDPTCNPVEIDNLSFGADETTIDWGDGTSIFFIPGTLDTSHVYPAADTATYIITLIAEDRGCISTWVDTITILPVITIVSTTWNCDNPLEFYYEVDTSVVTGDFCWDFGSGDVFCNQVEVSYTYPGPGTYSGEITTTDPIEYEGCELVQTFSSLVPDNDFSFDISTVGGCGSFEYSIASNVDPDFPSELYYTWNIGPSSISGFTDVITDTSFFNYTFPGEDAYPIKMTINDVNGCVYASIDTIIISGAVALFNIDSIVGCSPFTVYVSDASTLIDDAGGDISIESYEWNFSGGTCPTYFGISPPPCTFTSGTHSVTLTITDNGGCEFSYTEEIDVVSDVIASFIADELACNSTEPLYFSNTSTGDITDVLWDFGDGFTSTDFSALHPYPVGGAYTVSLTVSDAFGCSDVQVQNINVVLDSIYAGFDVTYLTASACPPIPLQLANTSTGDYIDFWWDVERETGIYTYTLDTIILTYTLPGDYDVSIYVMGATGCIDTLTIDNALYIPGPTGTMEYTPMMDCTPAEITFDFSDLTADLTYVDFGDGDTILVTGDATYNYAEEGVYCPTLILIDASGCSFQIACDSSITIYQTHDIEITVSDTGLCLGEILTIYNASTGSPLNPIEGYLVDYCDGTPVIPLASFDSLTHTYSTSGTYVLNVFTMSDVACGDTIQYEIEVFSEPEAGADISPISGCYPLDVNFTITDLIADVAILDYGDGNIDTIAGDISHTYTTFGIFHPTLTLINGSACAVEIEFADAVHVYFPPTAGLIVPDTIACSGEELIFINNSSDTSFSLITNYTLDFGDGSTPFSSDEMDTVYHAFTTDGSYISTFIVENSAGCTDTLIFNTYADQLPEGALSISPLEGCVPLEVNFDIIDLIADEAIIDFGDGNSDTVTSSIVYTYLNPGDFTPIFYLNNANGCTTVLTYETIDVELIPIAGFTISDTTICISTPVTIINNSFDTIVSPIISYAIKYGDGTVDILSDFDTLEYTYATPGTYNITVIAQNSAGCRDTIIHAVEVYDIPLATFSILPITGCIPFAVDFDLDMVVADEMLLYYGDGLMDTITGDTSHLYSTAGIFEPYLLISNNAGCFDSIAFDVVEAGITPIADFTITDSTICFGEPIEITNNAWDTTLSPITSYTIDFGDGTISTSATFTSLTHNYSSTGDFIITMEIENNLGCDDIISKNVSVGEMPFATLALDPLAGCLPLDITFDFESVSADEIIISFGDGIIDTVTSDVTYTYSSAGIFNPTVSLLNANGCVFDVIISDAINVGITPIADFTITDSTICFGEPIEITNNAWDTTLSPITSYTIDFGDGTVSTSAIFTTLTHNYSSTGDFIITLSVENNLGCDDVISKNASVGEMPFATLALDPLEGCLPLDITFDFESVSADEIIISFGDGNIDTVSSDVTYTYSSAGIFSPTVSLLNANGCVFDVIVSDEINVGITPIADFTITDSTICFGEDLEITNNAWDTTLSPITSYTIDFGDGTVSTSAIFTTLTHNYSSTGDFIITLSVENNLGCGDLISKNVSIGEMPFATLALDPLEGCLPLDITFDFDAIAADEIIIAFGDGIIDTVSGDVTYTYVDAGIFNPTVSLLNANGCAFDVIVSDAINVGITPIADFTITDSTICFGEDIEITNNDWDTTLSPITSYTIDFGDGTISTSATFTSLTHNYSSTGDFIITLSVENNLGCDDLISKNISVGEVPFATLALDPLEGCLPLDITFDFDAISADEIIISFGDGNIDTVSSDVTYTYSSAGIFSPTVSLLNANGCAFDVIVSDAINVGITPIADFTITDSTICFGEPIEITNNAWDTTLSPITSYTIDFGDGTVSTSAIFTTLTHNYSSTGDFIITLSVENNLGCDDIISKNVSVGEMPFATLALDPLEGCLPLDITFDFDAIAADEIIISFGDGIMDTVSGDVTYTYSSAGIFNPTVSLLNANGCAFDVIISDAINVGITPIADFTITDSTICFGEPIEITNNAWDTTLSPITSYTIDFGDGTISTSATFTSLTHNYSSTGDFIITLSVENNLGCDDLITKEIIVNEIPEAVIDFLPISGCYPLDVLFEISGLIADSAYINFGDGSGTEITGDVMHTFTTSGTYIPELTLINNNGCTLVLTETDPIHVAAPPVANMYLSDSSICAGESITIYNSSTDTIDAPINDIHLDYGDGAIAYTASSLDSINHIYAIAGLFTIELTVTNSLGCESTQNIPLSIAAIPTAVFDVEPVVGCGTLLSTFNIISSTADSLFLNTGTEIIYVAGSSINYYYDTPGVYYPEIILLNNTGCSAELLADDSLIVSYSPNAIMALSDTMPFCSGEEIFIINLSIDTIADLSINPIDNYAIQVNGSEMYSGSSMDSVLYNLSTAGDYWITLITSNSLGCLDSTSALITVTQTPNAIAGLNENICPGTALLLDGSASSGGTNYTWSPAGLFVNNSVAQPLGTFPTSTMVYLEYSNAFCSDIDSVLVNVLTDLELNAWPDTAICLGESIQIHSQYEADDLPVSIVWLNGDYLSSTLVSNPVSTPLNTITYTVAATCGDLIDYEDVTIVVNSLPTVVANDTMNAYYGQTFSLTSAASGNGPFTYSWTPTEYLGCSDCQNTNATPPSDATYFITVVDENNCVAMDSVYLRLGYDCGQYLGLPNLLSPNNDGFNDEFRYQSDAIQVLSYFRVYDRWGRLMFESTDLFGSWDGTYNGVLCDPGVYVYSIQGSCFDGELFINSGNITLVK